MYTDVDRKKNTDIEKAVYKKQVEGITWRDIVAMMIAQFQIIFPLLGLFIGIMILIIAIIV